MWRVLLDLLAAARRPLVVVDFETSGLGGKPPVEFAVLVWAPWRTPEEDETTRRCRGLVPPGLTYACSQRLDPGCQIDPGALAVHKIGPAEVRGMPAWNDLEVVGFFQGLAAGDAAEGEGPAVWVGHNAQEADLAWSRLWGYMPPSEPDAVDTMRIARRLAKEHPFPLSVDIVTTFGDVPDLGAHGVHVPATEHGLDAYAGSLVGLHVALTGARHEAHGAMSDCLAAARVLCRMLEMWDTLWPPSRQDLPPATNLAAMLAALDAPPPGQVSWDGWLGPDESKVAGTGYVWRRGKFKGQVAHRDAYVLDLPRLPTGLEDKTWWCSQHTADILQGLRPMAVAR
jgi:DNA polymerase III epsilon subunit-like protein